MLAQVLTLIADYVKMCPYDLPADGPLFVGARGGPLSPRIVQLAMARLRGIGCNAPEGVAEAFYVRKMVF